MLQIIPNSKMVNLRGCVFLLGTILVQVRSEPGPLFIPSESQVKPSYGPPPSPSYGPPKPSYQPQKPSYNPPPKFDLNFKPPKFDFNLKPIRLPTLPSIPKLRLPSLDLKLPKLPKVSLPSLKYKKPSLPRLPKLKLPTIPKLQLPKLPKLKLPTIPKLELPKIKKPTYKAGIQMRKFSLGVFIPLRVLNIYTEINLDRRKKRQLFHIYFFLL